MATGVVLNTESPRREGGRPLPCKHSRSAGRRYCRDRPPSGSDGGSRAYTALEPLELLKMRSGSPSDQFPSATPASGTGASSLLTVPGALAALLALTFGAAACSGSHDEKPAGRAQGTARQVRVVPAS